MLWILGGIVVVAVGIAIWGSYSGIFKSSAVGNTGVFVNVTGVVTNKATGKPIVASLVFHCTNPTDTAKCGADRTGTSGTDGKYKLNDNIKAYTVILDPTGKPIPGSKHDFIWAVTVTSGSLKGEFSESFPNATVNKTDPVTRNYAIGSSTTHKACSANKCVDVDGAGTNQCASDADCVTTQGLSAAIYLGGVHPACEDSQANCTVTLTTDKGSKTWSGVHGDNNPGTAVWLSPKWELAPGEYSLTGGTLVSGSGLTYKLNGLRTSEPKTPPITWMSIPRLFTILAGKNVTFYLSFQAPQ